jgi:hypothetical protein
MVRLLLLVRKVAGSMPITNAEDIPEKHKRPLPTIKVEESSIYEDIVGGVIDAFDREGHKEIERRVALIYNNYPTKNRRVWLVGDSGGQNDFLCNILGNDLLFVRTLSAGARLELTHTYPRAAKYIKKVDSGAIGKEAQHCNRRQQSYCLRSTLAAW